MKQLWLKENLIRISFAHARTHENNTAFEIAEDVE